jgi:hypothetical protein
MLAYSVKNDTCCMWHSFAEPALAVATAIKIHDYSEDQQE